MGAGVKNLCYSYDFQSRNSFRYYIMTKHVVCNRSLQTLASCKYCQRIYLVWWLRRIMEESGAIKVLIVFVDLKRIIKENVSFCL